MIDDLEELEETFGATLRLALHHAAESVDVEPRDEDVFVAVLDEPVVRRPRRVRVLAAVAAVLLAAIAGTIVIVHVSRSTSSIHEAVEIAPGWALSREGPIGIRTGGVFLWDGSGVVLWGGASYDKTGHLQPAADDGAVYDAATDTWKVIDRAPIAGRRSAKAVWTGSRVVIWGGVDDQGRGLHDGALFDPSSGGPRWPMHRRRFQPLARLPCGQERRCWSGEVQQGRRVRPSIRKPNNGGCYQMPRSPRGPLTTPPGPRRS